MKPKFLSLSGVRTLVQWIKDMLSEKVDKEDGKTLSDNNYSDSDVAKLAGIEEGSQENVIESISVNGTTQTVNNKNVEIAVPLVDATLSQSGQAADAEQVGEVMQDFTDAFVRVGTQIRDVRESVPTTTSQLTNDSDFTTKAYVDDEIAGVEASIPTNVSQLTNDSDFVTATQLDDELATKQDAMDYGTVTAEDVGKAMMPKTVANGKVTSWEFGEAGKVDDVQINGTSILENKVANVPVANSTGHGVVKVNALYGIGIRSDGTLQVTPAASSAIKSGMKIKTPITPDFQHESTFYGLAKAAGDSTQSSSSNAVGQYTDEAKTAIQSMLGIDTAIADAIGDITSFDFQVVTELPATGGEGIIYLVAHSHGANDIYDEYIWINNGYEKIGNTDVDLSNYVTFDDLPENVVIIDGDLVQLNVQYADSTMTDEKLFNMIEESAANNDKKMYVLRLNVQSTEETTYKLMFYLHQRMATSEMTCYLFQNFYIDNRKTIGIFLALISSELNGNSHIVWEAIPYNKVDAPQVDGKVGQVLTIANEYGWTAWADPTVAVEDVQVNGTTVLSNGIASVTVPTKVSDLTNDSNYATTTYVDNEIAEIDLSDYALSSQIPTNNNQLTNGAGYQTENDVKAVVADSFQDGIEVTVSGTTPTITANPNTRYICGEVTSLTVTPPENGVTEVIFTAGTTVPTLTLPATVKMPEWFTIESGYTYAINIENATYGTVMMWQT